MSQVIIRNTNKKFAEIHAVKAVNLQIRDQDVAIAYSFFVEHYVSGLTGSVKG